MVATSHGGLNVPDDARIDVNADPRLSERIRVVSGEPRMRYLLNDCSEEQFADNVPADHTAHARLLGVSQGSPE